MFKCDTVVMMNLAAVPLTKRQFAIAFKNLHQEIVGEAKHRAPPPPPAASGINYSHGHNMRSINPNGVVDEYEHIDVDPDNPKVAIFTTSGYGGWLEVGTAKQAARPYIVPAVEGVIHRDGRRILEGTIGR